ncbi:hypothetical protein [Candidatus Agathobaculum pullicola]|uniref:hypothetical protein n=1 Tax=Candidatus Agathobaculum pullicola TaxID=2838426 RepID=UPI003F8EE398
MTTNEQLHRIDSDIARYQGKVKTLQNKIMQLGEKKKKLQERALLEQLSELAPDYAQAEQLLVRLKAEQQRNSMADRDGGVSHDGVGQQDHG